MTFPTRNSTEPSTESTECQHCHGAGWVIGSTGALVRCGACADFAAESGLTTSELATTAESIKGKTDLQVVLRWLVNDVTSNPFGWITLFGSYGTAKSMAAMAIAANMVRAKMPVRYYHARRLEELWLADTRGQTDNASFLRTYPALVIDETDKLNTGSDWMRKGLQELADARYRSGRMGNTLTVWIVQNDPAACLPGDIASRMNDGAFYRPWPGERNEFTVQRHSGLYVPGCINTTGTDARVYAPSIFQRK